MYHTWRIDGAAIRNNYFYIASDAPRLMRVTTILLPHSDPGSNLIVTLDIQTNLRNCSIYNRARDIHTLLLQYYNDMLLWPSHNHSPPAADEAEDMKKKREKKTY